VLLQSGGASLNDASGRALAVWAFHCGSESPASLPVRAMRTNEWGHPSRYYKGYVPTGKPSACSASKKNQHLCPSPHPSLPADSNASHWWMASCSGQGAGAPRGFSWRTLTQAAPIRSLDALNSNSIRDSLTQNGHSGEAPLLFLKVLVFDHGVQPLILAVQCCVMQRILELLLCEIEVLPGEAVVHIIGGGLLKAHVELLLD
jgi:hypothetical protein